MTIQPPKFLFIRLNDDFELKVNVPVFTIVMLLMALITLFANIFALFAVPLYLAVIFAAVSDKMEYRQENQLFDEEE